MAEVPTPLGIGNVLLQDGTWVKGFICENYALTEAINISHFGGWRAYIQSLQTTQHRAQDHSMGEVS